MKSIFRIKANIFQQKRKVFLLMSSIIVMGVFISGSIVIEQSVNNVVTYLRRSIPAVVGVTPNFESFETIDSSLISRDIIAQIGSLPYVRSYDYTIIYNAFGSYREYVLDKLINDQYEPREYYQFRLFGVSSPEVIFIENGMYELVAGRHFLIDEIDIQNRAEIAPIIISRQFAEINDLWIDSIVELFHSITISPYPIPAEPILVFNLEDVWNHPYNVYGNYYYSFEVVGIFEFTRQLPDLYWRIHDYEHIYQLIQADLANHQSMINLFFAPSWRVYDMRLREFENILLFERIFDLSPIRGSHIPAITNIERSFDPFWVLYDVQYIDRFISEVNLIIEPLGYQAQDLSGIVAAAILATNNLRSIANRFVWIASGGMIIAATLILLLYVHEKQREIGIYLALGERKKKIIASVLMEVLLIATTGLIIAFLLGINIAPIVSRNMFHNQLVANERDPFHFPDMIELVGFGQEMTSVEIMEIFEITLDFTTIITFFLIGSVVIVISTIAPVIYMLELSPKDILAQSVIK